MPAGAKAPGAAHAQAASIAGIAGTSAKPGPPSPSPAPMPTTENEQPAVSAAAAANAVGKRSLRGSMNDRIMSWPARPCGTIAAGCAMVSTTFKPVQELVGEAMQRGELGQAIALLDEALAKEKDKTLLFMAFELKALVEDFEGALGAIDLLLVAIDAPARPALEELRRCAVGDLQRSLVRTEPMIAGKRAATASPPPWQLAYVQAAVAHAGREYGKAAAAIDDGRAAVRPAPGTLHFAKGSLRFKDIHDADDLIGPQLVAVGTSGLLELAFHQLASVELLPARGFQDTVWLPARVMTRQGLPMMLRVPALYTGSGKHADPAVRLGQTAKLARDTGYAVGLGQRSFRLRTETGEDLVGIRQVRKIELDK